MRTNRIAAFCIHRLRNKRIDTHLCRRSQQQDVCVRARGLEVGVKSWEGNKGNGEKKTRKMSAIYNIVPAQPDDNAQDTVVDFRESHAHPPHRDL